ncbi:MAG: phosphotransferase family protein, partial [Acidimicrobiia bacterium]
GGESWSTRWPHLVVKSSHRGTMVEMDEGDVARSLAGDVAAMPAEARATLISAGRGVFSHVFRVWTADRSVVVKLPRSGPNGDAARESGAYERERLAYTELLNPGLPVPRCHGVIDTASGPAFVLEDLSRCESVDQIDGLRPTQTMAIVDALIHCHTELSVPRAHQLGVRTITPEGFDPDALAAGVNLVPDATVFRKVLSERTQRIDRFGSLEDPVVCHGDPRADNLVVGPGVRLFDWQQISIQAGEADLAWLAATSMSPRVRRSCEIDIVERYAVRMNRTFDDTWERYQAAMVVPALAVLLLAQRRAEGRLRRLVETSIHRIAIAVADHL